MSRLNYDKRMMARKYRSTWTSILCTSEAFCRHFGSKQCKNQHSVQKKLKIVPALNVIYVIFRWNWISSKMDKKRRKQQLNKPAESSNRRCYCSSIPRRHSHKMSETRTNIKYYAFIFQWKSHQHQLCFVWLLSLLAFLFISLYFNS